MEKEISAYRIEVLERFLNLETLIAAIISQHYFKRFDGKFVLEVLYDENFSFALKRNILVKILPDLDNKTLESLHRLNRIRNIFVHCGVELVQYNNGKVPLPFVPDSRDPKKKINFKELHAEFMKAEVAVGKYLFSTARKLGVQFTKTPPIG